MMISLEKIVSRQLKPLSSRDNHATMKYEPGGSRATRGHLASYPCGSVGCSERTHAIAGYHTLMGMRGHAFAIERASA